MKKSQVGLFEFQLGPIWIYTERSSLQPSAISEGKEKGEIIKRNAKSKKLENNIKSPAQRNRKKGTAVEQ